MSKSKDIILIIFLSFLLIVTLVFPLFVSYFGEHKLLSQVYTENIPKEESINKKEYTTADRIETIVKSKLQKTNMSLKKEELLSNGDFEKKAVEKVIKELEKFKDLHIIPAIDLTGEYKVEYFEYSIFPDPENPQNVINIIEYGLAFEDYMIGVWLDADNNIIYQFAIFSEKPLPKEYQIILPSEYGIYFDVELYKVLGNKQTEYDESAFYAEKDNKFLYRYEFDENHIGFELVYKAID